MGPGSKEVTRSKHKHFTRHLPCPKNSEGEGEADSISTSYVQLHKGEFNPDTYNAYLLN